MDTVTQILEAGQQLAAACEAISFSEPVTHVYHPLRYAWEPYAAYVRRYATGPRRTLFLGINPGPWGMAQTGVPFGEIPAVRDWLGITAPVGKPPQEHPKKPVTGFACTRSEVSGKRLWGLFAQRFETAEAFFADHFVVNYCPVLLTAGAGGRATNVLPEKLPPAEREPLFAACDAHLRILVETLRPRQLIGVGKFAEARLRELFEPEASHRGIHLFGSMLHPSPASPAANRGFAEAAAGQLESLGVWPLGEGAER